MQRSVVCGVVQCGTVYWQCNVQCTVERCAVVLWAVFFVVLCGVVSVALCCAQDSDTVHNNREA